MSPESRSNLGSKNVKIFCGIGPQFPKPQGQESRLSISRFSFVRQFRYLRVNFAKSRVSYQIFVPRGQKRQNFLRASAALGLALQTERTLIWNRKRTS